MKNTITTTLALICILGLGSSASAQNNGEECSYPITLTNYATEFGDPQKAVDTCKGYLQKNCGKGKLSAPKIHHVKLNDRGGWNVKCSATCTVTLKLCSELGDEELDYILFGDDLNFAY